MKTYSGHASKAKNKKTLIYAIVGVVSLIVLAVTITVAAAVSNRESGRVIETPSDPEPIAPVTEPGVVTYSLPLADGTLSRAASIDSLTYMPSLNMWKTHNGVDFAASEGAAVNAIADGTVASVEVTTLEGTVITINHDNGITSVYKSLGSASVEAGAKVAKGEAIGVAGTMMTENSDGVHVHLEMRSSGALVDPLEYLDVEIDK